MEFASVVLYKENLTYYQVFTQDGWHYQATLLRYKGNPMPPPPKQVKLYKQGFRWFGNAEEDLVKFLGFDIDQKLKQRTTKS